MDTFPPPHNQQSPQSARRDAHTQAVATAAQAAPATVTAATATPASVEGSAVPNADSKETPEPSSQVLTSEELYNHLNLVSRSFAITIPFMKEPLRDQVALAYLLCRIVDTVEDDANAALNDKITWLSDISFLASDNFADEDVLTGLRVRALDLTKNDGSAPDDVKLLSDLDKAVHLLLTYDDEIKDIICHAVSILAQGMSSALRRKREHEEINSLDDVDNYCYSVAGVVGEMLAELFCVADKKADKKELLELAVSFGEGLQLTNILRDRAKDEARGARFLPATEAEGVLEYVAITQGHLDDAISFICELSPTRSAGTRMFCLTNVAMAMSLLRQVSHNPMDPQCNYKISRSKVKRLFVLCRMAVRSNAALKTLAFVLSFGMKRQRRSARQLRDKVSLWDHYA